MKNLKFIFAISFISSITLGFLYDQRERMSTSQHKDIAQSTIKQRHTEAGQVEVKDMTLEQLMEIPVVESDSTPEYY